MDRVAGSRSKGYVAGCMADLYVQEMVFIEESIALKLKDRSIFSTMMDIYRC